MLLQHFIDIIEERKKERRRKKKMIQCISSNYGPAELGVPVGLVAFAALGAFAVA